MPDTDVPVDKPLTLRVKFDANARYSVFLFKQDANGWVNAPLQTDAIVIGSGGADYPFGPMPPKSHWAVVVRANMTTTEDIGDVSCEVNVLVGDEVKAAKTASGTISSPERRPRMNARRFSAPGARRSRSAA